MSGRETSTIQNTVDAMSCPPLLALPLTAPRVEKRVLPGKSSSDLHPLSALIESVTLYRCGPFCTWVVEMKVSEIRGVSDHGAKDAVLGWSGGVLGHLAVSGT